MTKPRLPGAHETPTPSGEGEPFVVLLVGDGYKGGEGMREEPNVVDGATLRRELAVLLEEVDKLPPENFPAQGGGGRSRELQSQKARQVVKNSLRGMN